MKKIIILFIIYLFNTPGYCQVKYNIVAMRFGMKQADGSYKDGRLFKEIGSIIFDYGKVYISTKGLETLNIDSEIGDIFLGDFELISFAVSDPNTLEKYRFVVKMPVKPRKDGYNTYSILYDDGLSITYITTSMSTDSD